MDKREFLKKGLVGAFALVAIPSFAKKSIANNERKLLAADSLTFDPKLLSDFVDENTMIEHHNYFRQLVKQLNNSLSGYANNVRPRHILRNPGGFSSELKMLSGNFINHRIFFKSLTPHANETIAVDLSDKITKDFGSVENLKQQFINESMALPSDGWAWIVYNNNKLRVISTEDNHNPFMADLSYDQQGFPLLGLDLWKHSRGISDKELYVSKFWQYVDWNFVNHRYQRALQSGF